MAYASAAFRQSISTDSEVYYWDRPDIADEDTFFMLSRGRDGWNWKYLVRRFGAAPAWVIVSIMDDTVGRGTFGPEYATLDYEELSTVHHLCVRQLQNIVRKLARDGVFLRHPDSDLLVKVDMSRLREAPVRGPLVKPRKPPVRESAEIHFRERLAAFVQIAPVSAAPVAEMHFRESVTDFPVPETYCPWKWSCPHLDNDLAGDKNLKNGKNSLSSSSLEEPTTTGSATDAVPPDAAPDCPTPSEQRIADDPPDRRDTVNSASVRPTDRTERKRALPRPPQRRAKNGGDRPDGGSRRADVPTGDQQNAAVLRDPVHCPPVVADEVERQLGVADQEILDRIWRECSRAAPGLTADELVLLVRRSAPKVRAKSNQSVHGLLLTDLVRAAGTPRVMQRIRQYLAEGAPQRQSEETCVVPELFRRDEPSGSAWSRIQQQLCGILSADAMENWFAPCRTLSDEDGVLTIACRDEATVECMTIDNAVAITRAVVKLGLDTCIAFVVPAG